MHTLSLFARPRVAHACRLTAIWGGFFAFFAFLLGAAKPPIEQNPLANPALIGAWTALLVAVAGIVAPLLAILAKVLGIDGKIAALDVRNTEMTSESVQQGRENARKLDQLAADLRPRTVLVVEDEPQSGAAMCQVLAMAGFAPMLAVTARTAKALLNLRPEHVVCDLNLTSGSGWDVIDAIRGGAAPTKPVIYSAAGADSKEIKDRLKAYKGLPYFTKPDLTGLLAYLSATSRPASESSGPLVIPADGSDPDIVTIPPAAPIPGPT